MPNSDGISKISLLSCRPTFTKKYPVAMNPIEIGNDNNLHKNPDMRPLSSKKNYLHHKSKSFQLRLSR